METAGNLNLRFHVFLKAVFCSYFILLICELKLFHMQTTTLYAKVASPYECTNVANSLNMDLAKIQLQCSTWRMKLNHRKILNYY